MIKTESQIIDHFGRQHDYLRISLTDRCNLRCFYCMPEDGIKLTPKPEIMTLEEIVAISSEFVRLGVNTIRLTGGEPLIRKGFDLLVRKLADLNIKLKLTTNGILLDRYFDLFEDVNLNHINISLDTLDKVKSVFISKRDYYDRIMSNIDTALERGLKIKLNVVLIKGINDDEICDFIELTKNRNLIIKFIEFMPFKGNKWDWSKGISEAVILEKVNSNFAHVSQLARKSHSTSNSYKVDGHKAHFSIVSTITKPFCSDCNRIRLTADGKMKNCLFATQENDLLTAYRLGQDIKPLILQSIKSKKASRDGMSLKMDPNHYEQNRSMISIGG